MPCQEKLIAHQGFFKSEPYWTSLGRRGLNGRGKALLSAT